MVDEPLTPRSKGADRPVIPGYEVEGVLGRGATGVVYRARQQPVGREVALKVLHPELSGKERVVKRLQREARTTARLAHPHLVSAVDFGETKGQWWYAMEFVDGPSLALRLREEGRLREREALRLFIPLCEALGHLAQHGVVHRDIKPANILIDHASGARLADLGLAFADDEDKDLTKQGGTLGTPAYISPEQAVDPRSADVRSDLWSFGATLFHAVCGRPPFRAESAAEVLSCVLYARIPHPQELEPSLSKGLSLVLRKCLTREPESRYQTPEELLADLERIRERRLPKVRRGQLDPVQTRHDPRATWWVVAVIVVVGLAGLLWATGALRSDAGEGSSTVAAKPTPHASLEDLAVRADADDGLLAQHLSEHAALEVGLPSYNRERWEEVGRTLHDALRDEMRSLREDVDRRRADALADRDFARARGLMGDELGRTLLARTGFRLADVTAEPSLKPFGLWRARLVAETDSLESALVEEMETALAKWTDSRLERVGRLLEVKDWKRARKELLVEDAALLAAINFGDVRLGEKRREGVLGPVRRRLELRRQQLDDAWAELDRDLRREVSAHGERLAKRLDEEKSWFAASAELVEGFEKLLGDRGLTRERMPDDLPHAALDRLEEQRTELLRLEDGLLEQKARRALAETVRLSEPGWRNREYEEVLRLWEAVGGDLERPAGLPEAGWRDELVAEVELRCVESRRLGGLLQLAALRVSELDGQTADLRIRGILYEDRRIVSGSDPLADGFLLVGLSERLDLRSLATAELETLAGFPAEDELDSDGRLLVALLRHRDGEFEAANRALRGGGGELPTKGILGRLAEDLGVRNNDALAELEYRRGARLAEAVRLLGQVFDTELQKRDPTRVFLRIDELLGDYADLPEVQARHAELVKVRDGLVGRASAMIEDFERVFGPAHVEFPALNRVRMEFDFLDEEVGAWESGDWAFDNQGWSPEPRAAVTRLDDLRRQVGPTLILRRPLDTSGGEIELTLVVAQPASDRTRLLVVSAAGFHVAFVGTHLPGPDQGERLVLSTSSLEELLDKISRGEGEPTGSLLTPGETHELHFRLSPRSGKIVVRVDGREIPHPQLKRPDPGALRIRLRSWEKVSLRRAVLTARR